MSKMIMLVRAEIDIEADQKFYLDCHKYAKHIICIPMNDKKLMQEQLASARLQL